MGHPPGEFVRVDGGRLHYIERGSGAPLIFLHGNDATHLDFTLSILDRAAERHRAVVFDRPGHGYSERPRGSASLLRHLDLIREAVAQLGIARPVLVAHSWSGYLALAWAVLYGEELAGALLLAPAAYSYGSGLFRDPRFLTLVPGGRMLWPAAASAAYPFILRAIRNSFAPATVPAHWLEAAEPFQIRSAAQVRAAAEDFLAPAREIPKLAARYPKIRIPLVIATGDRDKSVPAEAHAFRLAKEVPHARLLTVEGAGHMLQFTHPEEVMRAIDLIVSFA